MWSDWRVTVSLAFYLKWRPETFAEVVGQEAVVDTVQNALQAERLYMHTYSRGRAALARLRWRACLQKR